jgi:hypothetical protein
MIHGVLRARDLGSLYNSELARQYKFTVDRGVLGKLLFGFDSAAGEI